MSTTDKTEPQTKPIDARFSRRLDEDDLPTISGEVSPERRGIITRIRESIASLRQERQRSEQELIESANLVAAYDGLQQALRDAKVKHERFVKELDVFIADADGMAARTANQIPYLTYDQWVTGLCANLAHRAEAKTHRAEIVAAAQAEIVGRVEEQARVFVQENRSALKACGAI